MAEQIRFKGMILQEVSREEFDRSNDGFKLMRWKQKLYPTEWFFKMIKPIKSFKEIYEMKGGENNNAKFNTESKRKTT